MGVTTTHDRLVSSARDHIESSVSDLLEALKPDTWGAEDYRNERIEELLRIALELQVIKNKI
jgi:hypothetical protein